MEKGTAFQGILFIGFVSFALTCDPYRGPVGSVVCHKSAKYEGKYQWETCVTNAYIRAKSNGSKSCQNEDHTFCYNSCMQELYGQDNGTVYDKCSCTPTDTLPPEPKPLPTLCNSPDGRQCKWYRTCLQDYFSCYSKEVSESLGFAESFCRLFETHGAKFTTIAQQWIDGLRICFQVELVPLLRPYNRPRPDSTCTDISTKAFQTKSECFAKSFKNGISKCDIVVDDYLKIMATLRSNVKGTSFFELLPNLIFYNTRCKYVVPSKLGLIQVVISEQQATQDISKTSERLEVAYERYSIRNRKAEQYIFYPFDFEAKDRVERSVAASEGMTIKVLFVDRREYDLNYNGNLLNNTRDGKFLDAIMNDIESGKFQFRSPLQVDQIRVCSDFECSKVTRVVEPPPTVKKEEENYVTLKYVGIGLGIVFGVCILIGLVLVCRGTQKQKVHASQSSESD